MLETKVVVGLVGQLVENVVCTLLETVVIGSTSYVAKEFVSPWTWTDIILVDIGFNVTYVLFGMPHVRKAFHHLFKKPCQKIGRKILGLDIRDPWAFLKIKYSIMFTVMVTLLVAAHSIQNFATFVRLMCFETFIIQMSIDVWNFRGDDIQDYVTMQMEPKPQVRLLNNTKEAKEEVEKAHVSPRRSRPGTPRLLNAVLYDDHMKL